MYKEIIEKSNWVWFKIKLNCTWFLAEIVLGVSFVSVFAFIVSANVRNSFGLLLNWINCSSNRLPEFLLSLLLLIYTGIKLKVSRDEMFERLFNDFNRRFDSMNELLNKVREDTIILKAGMDGNCKSKEDNIKDYLNLCAEEYLWYKKCRIEPKVWNSWFNGMCFYLAHEHFEKVLTLQRKENSSYYGLFDYLTKEKLEKYKLKNPSQFKPVH